MDFELYAEQNSRVFVVEDSPGSRGSWIIASDGSMDNNDEYFGWTNSLKIDDKFEGEGGNKAARKRKLSVDNGKIKAGNYKNLKDPLECEADDKQYPAKKMATQNGRYLRVLGFLTNIVASLF